MRTYDADSAAYPEDLERKEDATMACETTTGRIQPDVTVVGFPDGFVDSGMVPTQ